MFVCLFDVVVQSLPTTIGPGLQGPQSPFSTLAGRLGLSFYCMSVCVYTHTCQCTRACKSVRESSRKTCREKEKTVRDFSSSFFKIEEPGVEELERKRNLNISD